LNENYDLSVKNPNRKTEVELREPSEIIDEMQRLNKESEQLLKELVKSVK